MVEVNKVERNKLIMWRMIDEIWNQGNFDVADELFAPDHMSPSAPDLPVGSESVKMLARSFHEAMPDYRMTIDLMVADEQQVSGRFTQSGTHTGPALFGIEPSGRKATWTEIGVLQINDAGQIVKSWYEVDLLAMIGQLTTPTPREVVEAYFKHVNAGEWDAWSDLFAENCEVDEQLGGHIEGQATLRDIVRGFPEAYSKFENTPKVILVDGNQAAAVTHISALAVEHPDRPIEAEATNYFRIENGKIAYMANFHDSRPFQPFLEQIGAAAG